ncbi:hypothetical protein DL93DRAFT_2164394 [Clavulina sp. PMI_390]|nr:hypothetical protein DL93DRAFT_2164394 [Clavulina sp. PMI_390]
MESSEVDKMQERAAATPELELPESTSSLQETPSHSGKAKDALNGLTNDQSLTEIDRLRLQNYSSPINRLPTEILGEILRICTPCPSLSSYNLDPRDQTPWKRSARSVCHRWRAIVISLSEIWSWVLISESTSEAEITTWVNRAGSRTLDIVVDFDIDGANYMASDLPNWMILAAWDVVLAQARPIRTLRIFAGKMDISSIFPLKCNISEMETLVLENFLYDLSSDDRQATPFFLFPSPPPPSLKTLALRRPADNHCLGVSEDQSSDLSSLEVLQVTSGLEVFDGLQQLGTCCSLKYLHWNSASPIPKGFMSGSPRLLLPNVEHFVGEGKYLLEAFRVFEFPKLHSLALPIHDLKLCASISQQRNLRHFIIQDLPRRLNAEGARQILSSLANIVYLKVKNHSWGGRLSYDVLIEALSHTNSAATSGDADLCPSLKAIELTDLPKDNLFPIFKAFVETRVYSAIAPLEFYMNYFYHPWIIDREPWMDVIRWEKFKLPYDDEVF